MVEDLFKEGKLLVIPRRSAKGVQVFQHVANQFESGGKYTEREADQRLKEIYEDCTLLGRYLVDYQCLGRDKLGRIYQKCGQYTEAIQMAFFENSETR